MAMGVQKLTEVAVGKGGLPSKSVQHAKTLLAQKRLPQVEFVDSVLVVSLSPPSALTAGTKKRYTSTGWWLTCLGGPGNKLLCWSETMDRLIIPSAGLDRIMVYAVHQETLGVDSRLIAQVDHNAQQVRVISMDTDFWEGFFLAPSSTIAATPVKKTRVKKEKSPVLTQIKEKMAQYFSPLPPAAAAAVLVAPPPQKYAAPKSESIHPQQQLPKPPALVYQQQQLPKSQTSVYQPQRISPTPPAANYAYQQQPQAPVYQQQPRRISPPPPAANREFENYMYQQQPQRLSPPPPPAPVYQQQQQYAAVRRNLAAAYSQQQQQHPTRAYQEPTSTQVAPAVRSNNPPPPQASKFEDIFFL